MLDIFSLQSTTYFAFGQSRKTSLIAEFSRQNQYQHFQNPILDAVQKPFTNSVIIQAPIELFHQLQTLKPQMQAIFVGTVFTEDEIKIRRDYKKIGKCIEVREFNYELFRRAVYPNLVFFYGPIYEQNLNCAHALSNQIGYLQVNLPPNANIFIKQFKKTVNYVVCGFFTQKSQLQILQKYFNIKVIHLKYNRIDLPNKSDFFDKQFELLNFLKTKPYYYSVNGLDNDIKIIDDVSQMLSPALVYCHLDDEQTQRQQYLAQRQYLDDYVHRNQQNTIILTLTEVEEINRRKGIRSPENSYQKTNLLNEILYRDFTIKRAFILKFPSTLNQVLNFESDNRKFQAFVDLAKPQSIQFLQEFVTQMYFLQLQLRITPNTSKPLESYLNSSINYWLLNGVAGSGKTTVAKFLANQYGFKLIEYEPYFASIKQKLLAPQDGEQVPLRKILAHFKTLLSQNLNDTYIIDGLPFDNKDLEEWIKVIGVPSVINIEVDLKESILRTRKKNQGDLKEQIKQEEQTKANDSKAKTQSWLQKVHNLCPVIEVEELNFNSPLIQSQKLIHKLFRKNVYLVQWHNSLTFQNVALKHNLAFINLHMSPLRQSLQMIRKIQNKDLILCYYRQAEEKLVSEDLYWIEKNIGNIRYLAINQPEDINVHDEKIELQRPKAAEKPKVQGGQGEQKPAEEQAAQKKDVFDIFAYEWTKPSNGKNLSQWFSKSKKRLEEVDSSSGRQVFENWKSIIQPLSQSEETAIYHRFK